MAVFRAAREEDAYSRMKEVVRWYVSGFYKKPKVSWESLKTLQGTMSSFMYFEKIGYNFWKSSFPICFNLLHPQPFFFCFALESSLLKDLVISHCCISLLNLLDNWITATLHVPSQGLKKPYNPILGETFRCYWLHPNGTKTHFVAEQVSHHPPVSAFYLSNRKEGYVVNCSCLAKSKFYGEL